MGIILDNLLLMGPGTVFSPSYWKGIERRWNKMIDPVTKDTEDETTGQKTEDSAPKNNGGIMREMRDEYEAMLERRYRIMTGATDPKQLPAVPEKIVGMEMSATNEEESVLDEMEEEAIRQAIEEKSSW